MKFSTHDNESDCLTVQARLSDYIDSNLSARQVLDVEGHLTGCAHCATLARQMQSTVDLLHSAQQRDTSDDFMAKFHARLDGVEPTRSRGVLQAMRDWLNTLREPMMIGRIPALGLSMGVVALLIFFAAPTQPGHPQVAAPSQFAAPLSYNVALTASNPFDDPAAANLEAASARKDSSLTAETE